MSLRPALATALGVLALPWTSAHAHGGHHAPEWHWHATDLWGFLAIGALAALAIWLSRGD
jgi:peptidoglycan/LPS O-acetylase OafA/YrhL